MGKVAFWVDALERAVRTFAQSLLALAVGAGTDLVHTNWLAFLSVAGMAAVASLLTSIVATGVGDKTSAALVAAPAKPAA